MKKRIQELYLNVKKLDILVFIRLFLPLCVKNKTTPSVTHNSTLIQLC